MLLDIVRYVRLTNLIIIVGTMYVLRGFIISPFLHSYGLPFSLNEVNFILLILDVLIVTVSGYWINDHFDRDIDSINEPNRFLIKHSVSIIRFYWMYGSLVLSGLILSIYIAIDSSHLNNIWLYPTSIILLFVYASHFKRQGWIGNLLVSVFIALVPWLLILSEWKSIQLVRNLHPHNFSNFLYTFIQLSILIFCSNMARELVKDIEDIDGDRQGNSTSLPISFGINFVKKICIGLIASIICIETALHTNTTTSGIIISGSIIFVCVVSIYLLLKAHIKTNFTYVKHLLKTLMVMGLLQLIYEHI